MPIGNHHLEYRLKVQHTSKHLPTKPLSSHPFKYKRGTATCEALELHWQNGCLLRHPPGEIRSPLWYEPIGKWIQLNNKAWDPTDLRSILVGFRLGELSSTMHFFQSPPKVETSRREIPKLSGSKTEKTKTTFHAKNRQLMILYG